MSLSYLSPTSIGLYLTDPETFYVKYLSPYRPREKQTQAMSIGSAFDANVKAYLYKNLVLKDGDPNEEPHKTFLQEELFTKQVEPHNRDWAKEHGMYTFMQYKSLGALPDLFTDLKAAYDSTGVFPVFETSIQETIDGVPLLGKPDLYFKIPNPSDPDKHKLVIFDWKVNGYCSKAPVSPVAGYIRIRGGRTSGQAHPDCTTDRKFGMAFNNNGYFEHKHESWATQLAIYSWVLQKSPPHEDVLVAIDQLACKPVPGDYPEIRVAEHRMIVSLDFQKQMFEKIKKIWFAVQTDTVVPQNRKPILDDMAKELKRKYESTDPNDMAELEMTKKPWRGK